MRNELARESETPPTVPAPPDGAMEPGSETSIDPQRLLRIAAVAREVLTEARRVAPEPGTVDHLHEVLDRICGELEVSLPPKLYRELSLLTPNITEDSLPQLLLAHAEIIGWLQGLFQAVDLALAESRAQRATVERPDSSAAPARPDPRYL
jgi:hypothetical protein